MYELLALGAGVMIGTGWAISASSRLAALLLAGLGVAAAFAAFVLSGEAEVSAAFLGWDLLQVLLAALAARILTRRVIDARLRPARAADGHPLRDRPR
jgi:hypothetical protein